MTRVRGYSEVERRLMREWPHLGPIPKKMHQHSVRDLVDATVPSNQETHSVPTGDQQPDPLKLESSSER